ncbi:MAG TPA: fused MFS/spermidine synthase [Verrucomicrobiae bacterium]|nr:fused MFS/spermidine synthase [Verrucomicrobiae bacterium]
MQSKNRGWMVLALFFGSGATALIYEVVWAKFLAQMFGSTIYAQTVVLAVFMGGLALGNRIFGGWADGLRQPVKAYGVLEILIGIYAFLFPALDRIADRIFIAAGTPIAEHAGWVLLLKGVLSAGLLLGPTILMGGTLPLLAAWLHQFSTDAGRASARFYSVNSLGAVTGAALAGFWLVQHYGMIATLQLTATTNILIGAGAIWLNRSGKLDRPAVTAAATTVPLPETPVAPETLRWAGIIVALTGGVSMGLEVLASRSLALIFGSSLQSFSIVLMAFILGIGLGSAWVASPKRADKVGQKTVVLLLCAAAVWVTLLVFNLEHWVDFYQIARTGLGRTEVGYLYQLLLSTGIAMVVLGVPAACNGAVLPLMMRVVAAGGGPLGARVGVLLTWNTLGAVIGTLITGFLLMPFCGLRNAFGTLALILGLVALMVAFRRGWRAGIIGATGGCAFTVCLLAASDADWQSVMSSGAFRVWETKFDPQFMPMRKKHIAIRFYEDAPDATVSVEEVDGIIAPASLGLRINGKPDASTGLDLSTQFLVSNLPLIVKPDAKDVFVLGIGSGITAGAVLSYPVEKIVVAENCEPVVRAARLFGDWNRHLVDNPRVQIKTEDARTVLKLHRQLYDVIINEPSNPWTVGIGSVFSREYYELAASHLKPDGIMAAWFHVYEVNDDIVKLVLRTFGSVFPYMEVWDTRNGDIVMLGAMHPWATGPDVFRQGFAIDRVRTDMAMINITSPEALLARQVASQRTGFAIAGDGPIQSDMFPVLEYAAPQAFFMGSGTRVLDQFDERTRQQLLAPPEKNVALHSLALSAAQYVFSDFSTINGELYGCLFGYPSSATIPCVFQTPQPVPPPASDGSAVANAQRAFQASDLPQAEALLTMALKQNPNDALAAYVMRIIEREKKLRSTTAFKSP